jgi:hypothetical protein
MEDSVHPAPEKQAAVYLTLAPDASRNVRNVEMCDGDVRLRLLKLMRLCDQRRSGIRMARERSCSRSCGNGHPCPFRGREPAACRNSGRISGVGNGNRTRNRRSHSPVLCQLSYSHRLADYSNCDSELSDLKSTIAEGNRKLRGDQVRGVGEGLHRGTTDQDTETDQNFENAYRKRLTPSATRALRRHTQTLKPAAARNRAGSWCPR